MVKNSTLERTAPKLPRTRVSITCDRCHTPVRVVCGNFICHGCPLPFTVPAEAMTGKAVRS